LGYLGLKLVEFLLYDIFIIRKVRFQPLESTGVVLSLEVTLELVELLVGHLVCQPYSNPHFQRLINMFEKSVLFPVRQTTEPHLF